MQSHRTQDLKRKIEEKLNKEGLPLYGRYCFLVACVWLLTFEEPVTQLGIPVITLFRNILPLLAILYFFIGDYGGKTNENGLLNQERSGLLTSPFMLAGVVFALSGIAGWVMNRYQTLSVTIQAMYEHIRFWIVVWFFFALLLSLPLDKYAGKLFRHVGILTAALFVLSIADEIFNIWPRQIYRFGIGSIHLFFGHPSNFGAHCVFLLALLCVLYPYLKSADNKRTRESTAALILMAAALLMVLATLRVRLLGFAVLFLILFLIMIVLRKNLSLKLVIVCSAALLLVGWKRLYLYYFSPEAYTMARGQFAINSVRIANNNIPFGGGFGTFGSRMAQIHYSPLYYNYHMMTTPGMAPKRPSYACDTFFPAILGESGWLGFAAYLLLILLLVLLIFRMQKKALACASADLAVCRSSVFTAFILVTYELAESTGTLAFSETYSVMIAIVLGLSLAQLKKLSVAD